MSSIIEARTKLSVEYDRIFTSYHEAAHVICALLNFMKVDYVELEETSRIDGETIFSDISDVHDYQQFQNKAFISRLKKNEICVRYAGIAAERILYKKLCGSSKFPRVLSEGSSDDIRSISEVIKKYNLAEAGTTRTQLKNSLLKKSSKQLEDYWQDVVSLAYALFKRKKIHYNEIKKIILKKTNNKPFWKNQFSLIDFYFDETKDIDASNINFIVSNF